MPLRQKHPLQSVGGSLLLLVLLALSYCGIVQATDADRCQLSVSFILSMSKGWDQPHSAFLFLLSTPLFFHCIRDMSHTFGWTSHSHNMSSCTGIYGGRTPISHGYRRPSNGSNTCGIHGKIGRNPPRVCRSSSWLLSIT